MKTSQILTAKTFGIINHEQGIMRIPSQSKQLMDMLIGRKIGFTPKNEASSNELMNAWINGWDEAKIIIQNKI
jgi:hypothetical protein